MNGTFDFFSPRIVNGERVRQAREMVALTQADLARVARVSQPMVAHIEKGLKQPSIEIAETIARETDVSVDFLCRASGPTLPEGSLLFRARKDVSAKKLTQARALAERVLEIYIRMSESFNLPNVSLKSVQGSLESATLAVREMLGLSPERPIPHLVRAFEKAGGIALTIPHLDGREAFAVWAEDRPVIALGSTKSGDRLRFSVAHESGHLVLHQAPTAKAQAESDAHKFAAELLMPRAQISADLDTFLTLDLLGRLKQKWGVSISALLLRARELGLIKRRAYDRMVRELAPWRISEPSVFDIPVEKPRALRQMAEVLYGIEIDFPRMATDFGLSETFVREVLQRYTSNSEIGSASNDPKVVVINSRRPRELVASN
jgi:Zn-dependent peptidase ImmA (M78 family)/transcriptional regulator with XRE-family HTH domain